MDTKKSREEVNDQSDSPMDHGGAPRKDDSGWPEGPDGKRDAPRRVTDETKNPGIVNEEMADKQFKGELPEAPEVDEEEVEEEDAEGNKRKVKRKKSK